LLFQPAFQQFILILHQNLGQLAGRFFAHSDSIGEMGEFPVTREKTGGNLNCGSKKPATGSFLPGVTMMRKNAFYQFGVQVLLTAHNPARKNFDQENIVKRLVFAKAQAARASAPYPIARIIPGKKKLAGTGGFQRAASYPDWPGYGIIQPAFPSASGAMHAAAARCSRSAVPRP